MTELIKVLMARDGYTAQEAEAEVDNMFSLIMEGENPEDVLMDYGLEPDYIFDII